MNRFGAGNQNASTMQQDHDAGVIHTVPPEERAWTANWVNQ